MTIDEILAEIDERIDWAKDEHDSIFRIAPNSYGSGYQVGVWDALVNLRQFITSKD